MKTENDYFIALFHDKYIHHIILHEHLFYSKTM